MTAGAGAGDDTRNETVRLQTRQRRARPAILDLVLLAAVRELGSVLQMPGRCLHAVERRRLGRRSGAATRPAPAQGWCSRCAADLPQVDQDDEPAIGSSRGPAASDALGHWFRPAVSTSTPDLMAIAKGLTGYVPMSGSHRQR